MRTFFVPDSTTSKGQHEREVLWADLMREEFEMCYYSEGTFTYQDIEGMSPFERNAMYQLLVEAKEKEKEAIEKSTKIK